MKTTCLFATVAIFACAQGVAAFVSNAAESTHPAFAGSKSALHVATLPDIITGIIGEEETPFFASLTKGMLQDQVGIVKKKKKTGHGPLAPLVVLARDALGEKEFNNLRGNAIKLHSTAIRNFVGTSESTIGKFVLRMLFFAADKDEDGLLREAEIKVVLHDLGFTWLGDSQIRVIFERAEVQVPNHISLDEFIKEAPRTLSTNWVKLAKKNGGELGLLA